MKIEKKKLEKALFDALSILKKEKNVRIEGKDSSLSVCSSSEKMSLKAVASADDSGNISPIIVDGGYMMSIVKLCGEDITLSRVPDAIELDSGEIHVKFTAKRAIFPEIATLGDGFTEISDDEFIRKCTAVAHAASDNITSAPMLQAINISGTAENVTVTALDGRRIAIRGLNKSSDFNVSYFHQDIEALCALAGTDGKVSVSPRFIVYRDEKIEIICRALEGRYYDVPEILRKTRFPYRIKCDRNELLRLVRLGSVASHEITADISENALRISASGAEMYVHSNILFESDAPMPPVSFRIDADCVKSAVESLRGSNIEMLFFTSMMPVAFIGKEDEKEIVMPMIN